MAEERWLDELSAYWNAVVAGEATPPGSIGPETRGALDWALSLDDAPAPDASFVARLEAQLTPQSADRPSSAHPATHNGHRRTLGGHLQIVSTPAHLTGTESERRSPWWTSPFSWSTVQGRRLMSAASLALVLLLTLGGVWRVIEHRGAGTGNAIQVTFELVPSLRYQAYVERVVLEPGSYYPATSVGPSIIAIEDGAVAFQSSFDQEERVLSTGAYAQVSSGSTCILENTTGQTVTLLVVGLAPTGILGSTGDIAPGVHLDRLSSLWFGADLPNRARVTLQRTTIADGDHAPRWRTTGRTWIIVQAGDVAVTMTGEALPFPYTSGVERPPPNARSISLPAGVSVDVRNTGKTPLTLLMLNVAPEPAMSP